MSPAGWPLVTRRNHVVRGLALSVPPLHLGREKRGVETEFNPMANDFINPTCVIESLKIPKRWASESFQIGERIHMLGGDRGSCTQGPSRAHPMPLFIWPVHL